MCFTLDYVKSMKRRCVEFNIEHGKRAFEVLFCPQLKMKITENDNSRALEPVQNIYTVFSFYVHVYLCVSVKFGQISSCLPSLHEEKKTDEHET